MSVYVVRLAGLDRIRVAATERLACDAAVFRDDYEACRNIAVMLRGRWHLCAPHGRKDELEVIDKG